MSRKYIGWACEASAPSPRSNRGRARLNIARAVGWIAGFACYVLVARYAAEAGDTATARRRLNDTRNLASPAQQQRVSVLLARLELNEHRPQAALGLLDALSQPLGDRKSVV